MERHPGWSMLAACLGRITLAEGVLWTMAVLFAGEKTAALLDPMPLLAAGTAGFLLNHLLLKKARPLLLMLGLNLLLASAGGFLLGGSSVGMAICIGAGMALGFFSLLYWEIERFRDETLVLQLQMLLVAAVWELWFSGQMEADALWVEATLLMAALQLGGVLLSKLCGTASEKGTVGRIQGQRFVSAATVLSVCGLVCCGAVVFTEPAGQIIGSGYSMTEGLLKSALTAFARLLLFLFQGRNIHLDAPSAGGNGDGGNADLLGVSGDGSGFDLMLMLVYGAVAATVLMLLVTLLKTLFHITVGAGRRSRRKNVKWKETDGTFLDWIREVWKELCRQIHGRRLLHRNPASVASLLVFLERKCARRQGETVRQFLQRLAEAAAETEPPMGEVLLRFADAADAACYAKDGNLLVSWEESEAIRSFFRENP